MSGNTGLTERQSLWLEHLRACGSGSLTGYAQAHGLDVRALYTGVRLRTRNGVI